MCLVKHHLAHDECLHAGVSAGFRLGDGHDLEKQLKLCVQKRGVLAAAGMTLTYREASRNAAVACVELEKARTDVPEDFRNKRAARSQNVRRNVQRSKQQLRLNVFIDVVQACRATRHHVARKTNSNAGTNLSRPARRRRSRYQLSVP